ncbi:SusC/RagA family TonB-linked outer membrane protein [Haliscomenobacter hydrossis]|uniref:TonB-dependent receptor plug n=1 Tax=Haliscomenobacter hydrossis (strain ATCC 27775 / DSM 1100 / LMG 10767 / O) TaxID=760192 RepID=F4KRS5_HALH1|nr:SusC/RagA family TonB-linked outer membrane protein [Haliscomenobacter hydrossis]AEE50029.1 TonB-dependent receptor plug [Haliscomenobacter hydrossis DSM 1100]
MKPNLYLLAIGLLLCACPIFAQDVSVTGTVLSKDDSEALPGVSILVKGTTRGTVSDIDGKYALVVPSDAVLVFSYTGFTQVEEAVNGRTVIDLQMETDVLKLNEVIVTAVGISRAQKALGYSVERVDAEKVQQTSEPDVLRSLSGKVPGVNIIGSSGVPGSATRITLRGNRSFFGNNQPLIVVDGIPYNNETNGVNASGNSQLVGGGAFSSRLADLDPNNIESINVLKGGAAAALYGIRAANGVLLITTKTGSSRVSKKGLEVTYSSSVSLENIANVPDYQNTYGTGTGFVYAASNGSWGAPFKNAVAYPTIDSTPIWATYANAFPTLRGTKYPYRAYPNNVKDFFETGVVAENSLTISGGTNKSSLIATISKMDQTGYIPNSSFKRFNLSLGGNTTLDNGLIISSNLAFTNSQQFGPSGGANNATGNASAFGRTMFMGRNWPLQDLPFEDPTTRGSVFFLPVGSATNPYWSTEYDGFSADVNRIVASLGANYNLTPWLSAAYKIGINNYSQNDKEWFRPGSRGAGGIGQIAEGTTVFTEIESNLLLTATTQLTPDFNLRAVVGHNLNQRTFNEQRVRGQSMVNFNILDLDNTSNVIPFGGDYERRRLYGMFADLTIDYRGFAFLNFTGRNDWSSTLPAENRSFFYPGVNGSLVFTDALKMKSSVLNYGKIRASWATVGNDAPAYSLQSIYLINLGASSNLVGAIRQNDFPFRGLSAATLSNTAADPNLKPEFTRSVEVGTELKFFTGRIGLDVTYYKTRTTDQIGRLSLPAASGFSNLLTNFGVLDNEGIEVGLSLDPLRSEKGFNWNIYTTFTHNKNLVRELAPGLEEIEIQGLFGGSVTPVLRPGLPYGVIRGTVSQRDEEGNLLIDPSNGQLITALQEDIVGDPNPDFILGLTNTFSFRGLSLNVVLDYRKGGDLYSGTVAQMLGRGVLKDTEKREMNYVIPGFLGDPNTGLPLLDERGNKISNNIQVELNDMYFGNTFALLGNDEWGVFDATTIRIREVGLSYTLPKNVLQRTPIGSLRISVTGRNLWYKAPNFPKSSKFDPETSTFGNQNFVGFEYQAAPSVRRIGLNLQATF